MARCGTQHRVLSNGVGKCSVPMWRMGFPAGFCDEPAYGERPEPEYYWTDNRGVRHRSDMKYNGYVPALACPAHGGPKREAALNLCSHCTKDIPECDGEPQFGCGVGNDNVYECVGYIPTPTPEERTPPQPEET